MSEEEREREQRGREGGENEKMKKEKNNNENVWEKKNEKGWKKFVKYLKIDDDKQYGSDKEWEVENQRIFHISKENERRERKRK